MAKEMRMLVLSRKVGERIQIGDGIEVTVVGIAGNRIQLGIVAPPDMRVLRSELIAAPVPAVSSPAASSSSTLAGPGAMGNCLAGP